MLSQKSERRKVLIAIEGPDYSGKSNLAEALVRGINFIYPNRAMTVGRPGGTPECSKWREAVTNHVLPSLTRQCFALAEEVLFRNTFKTDCDVVIFDRYNPISGQIYGPIEMVEPWQELVSCDLTFKMDLTIFIDTSQEILIQRVSKRVDKNEMDRIFESNIDSIVTKYRLMANSAWATTHCNPIVLHNNSSFDKLVTEAAYATSKLCGISFLNN